MELKATYTFNAPIDRVWAVLMDTDAIGACLPGSRGLRPVGEDRHEVELGLAVGAIAGDFKATVSLQDKEPPRAYTLAVEGTGRHGTVKGGARITLEADGDRTRVNVDAHAHVGGIIARVGQRLLEGVGRATMDRFCACLQKRWRANAALRCRERRKPLAGRTEHESRGSVAHPDDELRLGRPPLCRPPPGVARTVRFGFFADVKTAVNRLLLPAVPRSSPEESWRADGWAAEADQRLKWYVPRAVVLGRRKASISALRRAASSSPSSWAARCSPAGTSAGSACRSTASRGCRAAHRNRNRGARRPKSFAMCRIIRRRASNSMARHVPSILQPFDQLVKCRSLASPSASQEDRISYAGHLRGGDNRARRPGRLLRRLRYHHATIRARQMDHERQRHRRQMPPSPCTSRPSIAGKKIGRAADAMT